MFIWDSLPHASERPHLFILGHDCLLLVEHVAEPFTTSPEMNFASVRDKNEKKQGNKVLSDKKYCETCGIL